MSKPVLSKHNELVALDSGVWVSAAESDRVFIDYTDGDSIEERVFKQVQEADDRSVFSSELDHPWDEWALEYHLGSKRSNIYRGLNLSGVKTVLEVGCGCGAITRYLGEQGFKVDAIEGSLRRAQIARLRTAEFDNVQIISSNYHQLALGKSSYDLVVFTGVLEYSGAYAPEGVSPIEQLNCTLAHAKASLSQLGQILIAIENRSGFKYLAGATEDHLGVPSIGLLNYPEPKSRAITRGIRTWNKHEWRQIIEEAGFGAFQFCYPLPDYKVADAIVSDHFLDNAEHPEQVLDGCVSRDYLKRWQPQLLESQFWRTAAQTGTVSEFANSYLIVLCESKEQIAKTIDFDFVRFAGVEKVLSYRLQINKLQQDNNVRRISLVSEAPQQNGDDSFSQINIADEPYIDGETLTQRWCQALSILPTYDEFLVHLKEYVSWLDKPLAQDEIHCVDALPNNIIVDHAEKWHLVNQRWQSRLEISKENILFRALLDFALNARELLAEAELNASDQSADINSAHFAPELIETVEDFICWAFASVSMNFQDSRANCLAFESEMQKQIVREPFQRDIETALSTPIYQGRAAHSVTLPQTSVAIRAYWTQVEQIWHPDHSVVSETVFEQGLNVRLFLPKMVVGHRYLRIDPGTDVMHVYRGWWLFNGLSLIVARKNGAQSALVSINTAVELFKTAKCQGLRLLSGDRFMLNSSEAYWVLDLSLLDWGEEIEAIYLDISFDFALSENAATASQLMGAESTKTANRIRHRQRILNRYQERITQASDTLRDLEQNIAATQAKGSNQSYFERFVRKLGVRP